MEELELPSCYKKKFAVVKLWPNLQTAENEVIARLKNTAQMLGLDCIEISPNGSCVKTGKQITSEDADFAIHLHFDTPKNYDIFSFVALWNPLQFYFDFGYTRCCKNLISHDDFLSCLSTGADDHLKRLLLKQPLHLSPKFSMFHSLSSPVIQPTTQQRMLFYIGINWEKLGQGRSRHHELLKKLDETGYLRIYGPRIVQGVKVWKDFKSYVDEIPFDGISVLQAIHSAGAGLVLSSDAHRDSGLMSNRLFETVAAGAVVICDENPFAKKHFGDTLLYINTEADDVFSQINNHMAWINANPDSARELAIRAQKIFLQNFLLSHSLRSMYQELKERKKELSFGLDPLNTQNPSVALICIITDEMPDTEHRLIESCTKQDYCNINLILVVDSNCARLEAISEKLQKKAIRHRILRINNLYKMYQKKLGLCISEALKNIQDEAFDYFTILISHEEIFHNHITSQVRICIKQKTPCISATAAILIRNNKNDVEYETQSESKFDQDDQINPMIGYARFMFPKKIIQETVFYFLPYLNKKSLVALIGQHRVVSSSLVTARIHTYAPIFHLQLENHIEKQLIEEILDKDPIGAVYKKKLPFNNFKILLMDKLKMYVRRVPMPLRLRLMLRATYRKIKLNEN